LHIRIVQADEKLFKCGIAFTSFHVFSCLFICRYFIDLAFHMTS